MWDLMGHDPGAIQVKVTKLQGCRCTASVRRQGTENLHIYWQPAYQLAGHSDSVQDT